MNTRPLLTMKVKVARVLEVGAVPYGTRRIAPLDGGIRRITGGNRTVGDIDAP